jgi:hypothetical protein
MQRNQKTNKRKNTKGYMRGFNSHALPHKDRIDKRLSALLLTPLLTFIKLEQFPFLFIVVIIFVAYCYLFKK